MLTMRVREPPTMPTATNDVRFMGMEMQLDG